MADIDDKLDRIALQFADKVDLATSELVSYLKEIVKGKSSAEALEILSGINLDKAFELKLAKAFVEYEVGISEFLKSTYTTARPSESSIRALLKTSKKTVMDNMKIVSSITMQGIVEGIASSKTTEQTLETIMGQITKPEVVVRTAYNQFSNTLSTILAEELPANTKWIYVGANDSKTRDRCRSKIGAGALTRKQIINQFGDMNNEIWGCRHKWEQMSSSPKDQGYDPKEFVE